MSPLKTRVKARKKKLPSSPNYAWQAKQTFGGLAENFRLSFSFFWTVILSALPFCLSANSANMPLRHRRFGVPRVPTRFIAPLRSATRLRRAPTWRRRIKVLVSRKIGGCCDILFISHLHMNFYKVVLLFHIFFYSLLIDFKPFRNFLIRSIFFNYRNKTFF